MPDEHVSAGQRPFRTVHIVPHTHWDREWYRPYQSFRMRLVDLLDGLLPRLDADPGYAHFMLDGQMAVVDDYLAVRPAAEATIRSLAAAGRLSVGPWYVLMDEFLVSGETIVRNLSLGLERATGYGGAMEVGYLPDMFGHIAQMPQLLAQFGFDHAVVWRGVPAALDDDAFTWEAPDGSTVRAEYLSLGYGNGALLPDDAKELVARIEEFCSDGGALVGDPVLWMNGTDHLLPQAHLGRVVAEANAIQDDLRLEVTSLAHHLAVARSTDADLPRWQGELRSGARANLLMGVASNRIDVHQAEAVTTRLLEREAEPLSALWLPAEQWPSAFLAEAWLEVIRNSAHDSICACSVDEVGAAVLHRFGEAGAIARGLRDRALRAIAAHAGGDRALAVNTAGRARSGIVELDVPGEVAPEGTQLLEAHGAHQVLLVTDRASAAEIVAREMDIDPFVHAVEVHERPDAALTVTLRADGDRPHPAMVGPVRAALARATATGRPDGEVTVEKVGRATCRVLARVEDVAGFGWKRWNPGPLGVEPVRAGPGPRLSNGLVEVVVDEGDGSWALDGLAGFGRLVDDGDAGDTYNWCPPGHDEVVDRPGAVAIDLLEEGPLRARLAVVTTWEWPHRIEADRRTGHRSVQVRTVLEVRAGDDLLRVTHELDNRCEDHRLRVWFPLPEMAATSRAECAFTVVERGLTGEGGPTEAAMATFPSRRFVSAGGLTIVHEGLLEYELVDIDQEDGASAPVARSLALTLLRCTGVISRGPMSTRPLPAGPPTPSMAAQMPGLQRVSYAVHRGGRDPYAVADDAHLALLVARPRGGPSCGDEAEALRVDGAEVSAVLRPAMSPATGQDARLIVRVFNPSDAETTVSIPGRSGWLVDLRGRPIRPFEGTFPLRAQGIATAALEG